MIKLQQFLSLSHWR